MKGSVHNKIKEIREVILYHTAFIESALDDPEHISVDGYGDSLLGIVKDLQQKIQCLLDTADDGRIIKEGIKTVIITDEYAGRDGKSQSLADAHVSADAVVTGGNANEVIILPKLDKVIGTLDYVTKIAGASEDTLREDGSLEVELQVITGATNETGFNKLSAR